MKVQNALMQTLKAGQILNAQDVACFVVRVCLCDIISILCAYVCGRPGCVCVCASVCINEWVDKCMHGNVFPCVSMSPCVYTNIYLLLQVLS